MNKQYIEFKRQLNNKLSWKYSKEFSDSLLNFIDKPNLKEYAFEYYNIYINKLNNSRLNNTNKYKYIRIWNTMINTLNNNKNNIKIIRKSIKQLNYVSHLNYNKYI